jgi:hypothetical protein
MIIVILEQIGTEGVLLAFLLLMHSASGTQRGDIRAEEEQSGVLSAVMAMCCNVDHSFF